MDKRLNNLNSWARHIFSGEDVDLSSASADASFRRYFRVRHNSGTYIIMDAPPEKEDSEAFVRLSAYLRDLSLAVPEVIKSYPEQGFYLLSDLGSEPYLDILSNENAQLLYGDAMRALLVMQAQGSKTDVAIPDYNRDLLMSEMHLFSHWYLGQELKLSITASQNKILQSSYELLADSALNQAQVFVHRDYHSRNLMYIKKSDHKNLINPGILDFQDAVWGPVTYDLVSLLRDCYIAWPRAKVETWVGQYFSRLSAANIIDQPDATQFMRWFDLMGIQRHLKATGIFSRLKHRDNKPEYINDIPRTLNYIVSVAQDYPELKNFVLLLKELGMAVAESANVENME